MADLDGYRNLLGDKLDSEVMIWTAGGHYFRGTLSEINENGFLVVRDVSCTLAGERHERDFVSVNMEAVDAIS